MTFRPVLAIGAFRLDPVERLLSRHGRPVPLPPKAIDTLLVLVERPGRLVTKDDLLRAVWPDTFVEENNLAQHISTLRRVLGEGLPDGPVIETVPRRGYRFVGPIAEAPADVPAVPASVAGTPSGSEPPAQPAPAPTRSAASWRLALVAGLPLCLLFLLAWACAARPASTRARPRTPDARLVSPGLPSCPSPTSARPTRATSRQA